MPQWSNFVSPLAPCSAPLDSTDLRCEPLWCYSANDRGREGIAAIYTIPSHETCILTTEVEFPTLLSQSSHRSAKGLEGSCIHFRYMWLSNKLALKLSILEICLRTTMFTNRNSIITLKIIGKTMIINSMDTERSSYFWELKEYSRCVFLFPIPKSAELTRTLDLTWCAWWKEKGISDESYRLVATFLAPLKSTLRQLIVFLRTASQIFC